MTSAQNRPFVYVLLAVITVLCSYSSATNQPQPATVTVSLASPYYYASGNHHEWRVGVTFTGSKSDDLIDCIRWQSDINGSWQTIPSPGGSWKTITPDGLFNDYFNVRIYVRWDDGIRLYEATSTPLQIGCTQPESGEDWPGIDQGEVFSVCGE